MEIPQSKMYEMKKKAVLVVEFAVINVYMKKKISPIIQLCTSRN